MNKKLMREDELAGYLGISRSSLAKKRVSGFGPRYSKIGRAILYDLEDVNRWVEENKKSSTSEYQ